MNMVYDYEKENNFTYDMVVSSRFDICWNNPFSFSKLNNYQFHIPIHDFSPEIRQQNAYSSMFDFLDEYQLKMEHNIKSDTLIN